MPVGARIEAVHELPPNVDETLASVPCFINTWRLIREGRGPVREHYYDVRMQFACYDASLNQAARIATAFLTPTMDAFNKNPKLNVASIGHDTADQTHFAGGDPTLVKYTYGGMDYAGLDLHLAVDIFGAAP